MCSPLFNEDQSGWKFIGDGVSRWTSDNSSLDIKADTVIKCRITAAIDKGDTIVRHLLCVDCSKLWVLSEIIFLVLNSNKGCFFKKHWIPPYRCKTRSLLQRFHLLVCAQLLQ